MINQSLGLPANIDAEKVILGAILLDNTAYYEAVERGIEPDDFSLDSHRRIYSRMAGLMEAQRAVDIVTLAEELSRHKEVQAVGGVAYLAGLTEDLPRRPVIEEYILIVKDKAMARRLMSISSEAIATAADQSVTSATVVIDTIEQMEESLSRGVKRGGKTMGQIVMEDQPRFDKEANASEGGIVGASLFTKDLSTKTGGIKEGELCLLCARPHQGKTEAAIQVIVENARRGLRVHMFSLEMKDWQIKRRMERYMAKIHITKMRDLRTLTPAEKERLTEVRKELAILPIKIDDTHELTTGEYRSRCVLAAKRDKADLIVTDYSQLLLVPKAKSPVEEAKRQAETLRHISRDYCRTFALAQLRRAPPSDLNCYPDIEMIFGSSHFEQAAQIILLLHRTRKDKRYTGEDFCFIGKMRELQSVEPLGIAAEPWGAFKDRFAK